jgi:hypothetical protein
MVSFLVVIIAAAVGSQDPSGVCGALAPIKQHHDQEDENGSNQKDRRCV